MPTTTEHLPHHTISPVAWSTQNITAVVIHEDSAEEAAGTPDLPEHSYPTCTIRIHPGNLEVRGWKLCHISKSGTQSFLDRDERSSGRPKVHFGTDPGGVHVVKIHSATGLGAEEIVELKNSDASDACAIHESLSRAVSYAYDSWQPQMYRSRQKEE